MNRDNFISALSETRVFDFVIIGGGATGVASALEASSRGYKVLLVEQCDFGKGTSSRSTKLAHGGVRYLQQGNISLVLDALKERGIMRRNAPHLVKDLPFIVPVYDWWEGPFYGIGLKVYDLMAGSEGFGSSELLSKEETIEKIPTIEPDGLRGGVIYYDGQFDDTRLLINMAQTATEQGAIMLNYAKANRLIKEQGLITGVEIEDIETGISYTIHSKAVINATGVYTDHLRKQDDENVKNIMTSSQGVHIVLDKSFLPGEHAIMVPHTDDGRVLFAVPWHDKVIVGTTDTPVKEFPLEPKAQQEEIDFLMTHAARYLTKDPKPGDIKSIFTGLRPLVNKDEADSTAAISRDHYIEISRSGLITITGGKWTTARKMAEDVINQAALFVQLDIKTSNTQNLQIHGYHRYASNFGELHNYGSDAPSILSLIRDNPEYKKRLHPNYSITKGEVIWAVRNEMARTVEDFLARRTRLLFLDVKASMEAAPVVAKLMAIELEKDSNWIDNEIISFNKTASNYYFI